MLYQTVFKLQTFKLKKSYISLISPAITINIVIPNFRITIMEISGFLWKNLKIPTFISNNGQTIQTAQKYEPKHLAVPISSLIENGLWNHFL